jgi:hypothetical protein
MAWILVLNPPLLRPIAWSSSPSFLSAGAVLMCAYDGAVDHRVFVVRIGRQHFEDLLPCAALVSPFSIDGIARALLNVAVDPLLRSDLRKRARIQAAQFGARRTTLSIIDQYERALAAPKRLVDPSILSQSETAQIPFITGGFRNGTPDTDTRTRAPARLSVVIPTRVPWDAIQSTIGDFIRICLMPA